MTAAPRGRPADGGPRPQAAEATRLLFEATFVFWGHFVARAAELGLAPTQAHALTVMDPARPMTMRDIATALQCDPSTVTGVADRLEAQGFVGRQALPGDRRVRALALTAPGAERRARLVTRMLEAPASVAALDEASLDSLVSALQVILEREHQPQESQPREGF